MHPAKNQTTGPPARKNSDELRRWLLLAHQPGMYSRLYNRLLDALGSPEQIFSGTVEMLEACGASCETANAICAAGRGSVSDAARTGLDTCWRWLDADNHSILLRNDPAYPERLAAIPDPPPLLYVNGDPACLKAKMIAMVGSRRPSADGRRYARCFASELAALGIGVCSGLALGIDGESHAGALQSKGVTVAVLGTGIDVVYPTRNNKLFDDITVNGALVSEFNPGTPPLPPHFPRRNRIISGLSLGVLVVEAGLQSGSMITARMALEQGREVFAIPGSIHNPMAKGCHRLIGQGAKLVQDVADICEEFEELMQHAALNTPGPQASSSPPLPKELAKVLAAIGHDPVSVDVLLPETGMTVEKATALLAELEMAGLVRRDQRGYSRTLPD